MSVKYIPVQWNRSKWVYDAVMLAGVGLFLHLFLNVSPGVSDHTHPVSPQTHNARAFGACAFVMLSVILCIGPLARLDPRFLPLLYNRRHFGVMTVFVALTHAGYVLNWYFAFSSIDKYEAVLSANTSFGQIAGFPFEAFGIFALLCLVLLTATSHDFWLKFLTPPVWKRLHSLIYVAYAAVVAHIAWGILQDQQIHTLTAVFLLCAACVGGLHGWAAVADWRAGEGSAQGHDWVAVCPPGDIAEGRARIAVLPGGDRVAVFRHEGRLSAIANACAHQNGPLGEGRIVDCLVTCPWHGFQYNVTDGRSPAPFTEMVPTYDLRFAQGMVEVRVKANPPGTFVQPLEAPV